MHEGGKRLRFRRQRATRYWCCTVGKNNWHARMYGHRVLVPAQAIVGRARALRHSTAARLSEGWRGLLRALTGHTCQKRRMRSPLSLYVCNPPPAVFFFVAIVLECECRLCLLRSAVCRTEGARCATVVCSIYVVMVCGCQCCARPRARGGCWAAGSALRA